MTVQLDLVAANAQQVSLKSRFRLLLKAKLGMLAIRLANKIRCKYQIQRENWELIMPHPDQTFHKIESLSVVERKEYEELKDYHSAYQRKRREKIVFYGYCIVAILSTLSIMGLLGL